MYTSIYVYLYVYIFIFIHTHARTHTHKCQTIYIYICKYVYLRIDVHIFSIHMHTPMCRNVFVDMYLLISICIYLSTCPSVYLSVSLSISEMSRIQRGASAFFWLEPSLRSRKSWPRSRRWASSRRTSSTCTCQPLLPGVEGNFANRGSVYVTWMLGGLSHARTLKSEPQLPNSSVDHFRYLDSRASCHPLVSATTSLTLSAHCEPGAPCKLLKNVKIRLRGSFLGSIGKVLFLAIIQVPVS